MRARAILRLLLGLVLLGALGTRPGRAQEAGASFQCYNTEQGLSHNEILALAKDQRGFLWVGTASGLNRFDGVQFKTYTYTGRADGLPSNYIMHNGLVTDQQGYLWVSTNQGLYRFDPRQERGLTVPLPKPTDQPAANDLVSPIAFDRAGQGWFASSSHLYCINPRSLQLRSFPLPFPVPGDYPDVVFDAQERLWLYFQQAAYRFEQATRRYTYYLGRDDRHPHAQPLQKLARGGGPDLYALSSQGAQRYEARTDRFVAYTTIPFNLYALADVRSATGRPAVWLGDLGQLVRYDPVARSHTYFRHVPDDPHSYPGGRASVLLQDTLTGMLWIGTGRGLALLDPQTNNFRRQLVRLPGSRGPAELVQQVQQDRTHDSLYWVLSRRTGLWRWQGDSLRRVPHPPALGPHWRGLQQDTQGRLWVGLANGPGYGLARYDPATNHWQPLGLANEATPDPTCLYLDRAGRLWLGSFEQGLFWYDASADRLRPYPLPKGPAAQHTVRAMQEDAQGRLWVRTSQGLYAVSANRQQVRSVAWPRAALPLALSPIFSSVLLVDRQQHLWLSGQGWLVQADTAGRILRQYTRANGLHAVQLFGLIEDQREHLWLATDEQLHELDPATGQFTYYDQSSGVLANLSFQNFTRNRQGELFLGGEGGFNYFQPTQLSRNRLPPPVALTEVLVNNQFRPLRPDNTIELRPGETALTVGFAALNFSQARKNRYAYRLLGFDPSWTTTDARSATYTNLAPGTYQLRIRAANNDGVWNNSGQTLTIHVLPAYYQTWWFKAGSGLVLLAALWGVYRYREAQRRQLARVRDHLAKDLHDDMGSTLSSIRIFSEVAQGQLAGTHPQTLVLLQRISANASTLAESMQDIIWTVKPSQDGLADVVSRMREFGLRLTEAKGIAFKMSVEEPFPILHLSLEQRRNLYLIFKESVNNAVKYAACTALTVRLSVHQRQLHLHITDNGQGFDPATARAGNGLANLQARARDIGGQVRLTSALGAGTSVVLTAPLS